MVRQVLQLALRAWGTSVCAVKTEEEAISHLQLRSESHTHTLPGIMRYNRTRRSQQPWRHSYPATVWCLHCRLGMH